MVAWVPILWAAKHIGLYAFARQYGWVRLYRRLMEVNRKLSNGNVEAYKALRNPVQALFRSPTELTAIVEANKGLIRLFDEAMKYIARGSKPSIAADVKKTPMKP